MNYLQKYQEYLGLQPDGIIGPKTKNAIQKDLNIPTQEALAHLLGQIQHESCNFECGRERMTYSEERLRRIFKRYFKDNELEFYAYKPGQIACRVYANRMGNGDEHSGDGWRYRGVGAIQLTGKKNIESYLEYAGLKEPDDILTMPHYFKSAAWFFGQNNIWPLCGIVDMNAVLKVSKVINLGSVSSKFTPNGFDERLNFTKKHYA